MMNTCCYQAESPKERETITLQIAQIKIANWKYATETETEIERKRVNFAKTPIYRKKVFTLAWGGFSGNSKKE